MVMEYAPFHSQNVNHCRFLSHSHCLAMSGSVWEIALTVLGVGVFRRLRTLEEVSSVPGLTNSPPHDEGSLCSVDCLEYA